MAGFDNTGHEVKAALARRRWISPGVGRLLFVLGFVPPMWMLFWCFVTPRPSEKQAAELEAMYGAGWWEDTILAEEVHSERAAVREYQRTLQSGWLRAALTSLSLWFAAYLAHSRPTVVRFRLRQSGLSIDGETIAAARIERCLSEGGWLNIELRGGDWRCVGPMVDRDNVLDDIASYCQAVAPTSAERLLEESARADLLREQNALVLPPQRCAKSRRDRATTSANLREPPRLNRAFQLVVALRPRPAPVAGHSDTRIADCRGSSSNTSVPSAPTVTGAPPSRSSTSSPETNELGALTVRASLSWVLMATTTDSWL